MSDNKKYYYLKLKDNFFDSDELIILESMTDGYVYSNILLKLYLRSLRNEGKLMFNERIPFNSTMLSQLTRHSVGDVEKAIQIFSDLGLIEILDNGAIYLMDIQNFIGESSTEADRKRAYRAKIELEKKTVKELEQDLDKCPDKSTPKKELERELEIKKEIEKEKPSNKSDKVNHQENFNRLWELYPKGRKQGKDKAFTSYKKAIKEGVTDEVIEKAIEDYKKQIAIQQTELQFIKQGSTWFNQKCWDDEYITESTNSNYNSGWDAAAYANSFEVDKPSSFETSSEISINDLPF